MVRAALIFPGQGAQRVGMGKDLAERFAAARETFEAIDGALGMSLSRMMWEGPEDELTLTHNAQPAILAHSMAVHSVVREAVSGVVGAGHSLGEYSAYAAAGACEVADAARLVRARGELMLDAGRARPGTMAAVLGLPVDRVETICTDASTAEEVVVTANINAPDQAVISGDPPAVERASAGCREAGAKRVVPLKVSGAFHSPLMEPARAGLEQRLGQVGFRDPSFPVVANARAEAVSSGARARELLSEQLASPVRWVSSMREAASILDGDGTFVEMGPGRVLQGLLKRIVPDAPVVSLGTATEIDAFLGAMV
jgi:[acyl-carrier-protein] S-malonyltransferase